MITPPASDTVPWGYAAALAALAPCAHECLTSLVAGAGVPDRWRQLMSIFPGGHLVDGE